MPIIERPFVLEVALRDPVHDFIRVSVAERKIIDTEAVQRLRRIHQLGPSYLVYHGAEHSRFGHVVGAMEVVTRIFEAVERKRPEALGADPAERGRNWQLVRLAGLLHDVGHAPFSHATADVMPVGESGQALRHERYTTEIIKKDEELAQRINENFGNLGISPETIAAVIESPGELGPEGVVLHQMISGELDADRMDYLARDSLYTGATYGKFDIGRLLDTITVAKWRGESPWLLAVESGGSYALEQLLFARYYMYIQVYLHDGRRFFDYALNRFLQEWLSKDHDGHYPDLAQLDDYLQYDDQRVLEAAREWASAGNQWAQVIWHRRPWKTVDDTDPHPSSSKVRAWSLAQGRMEEQFGSDEVYFDDAEAQFYHRTELGPYSLHTAEEEGKYPILVVGEGEEDGVAIEEHSSIVRNLSGEIMLMRLYGRPDRLTEIKERWRKHYE